MIRQLVQSHGYGVDIPLVSADDIQHSVAWKYAYEWIFGGDPRRISLAFCTDGVNPFKRDGISYSMSPIMLTLLNLPPGHSWLFFKCASCWHCTFKRAKYIGPLPRNFIGRDFNAIKSEYLWCLCELTIHVKDKSLVIRPRLSWNRYSVHLRPGTGYLACTLLTVAYRSCLQAVNKHLYCDVMP